MKGLLFFGALALLAFVSCKDIDVPYVPEDTQEETYDEAWYADNATVSSSDTHFSFTEEGEGEISFKAEGGSVVVYVDCGTEWTADDSEAGVFGCDVQETCITVTADQNLLEEELYGTITLMTAASKIRFATIAVTQNAYGAPEIKVETNEWHIPAVAATAEELTTEIGVEATDEWSVECDAEWLTAEKGENGVSLTATENETFEERVATVVLTCTDGYNSDSETITVTQDARAYITLSAEEFEFDKMGGEAEVTVESNYEWSYACESDWFTVSEGTDGSLTITVDVNGTGADREGTVVFTAGDRAANVTETTLTITQGIEDPDALILEYTFIYSGSYNLTLVLPIADVTYAEIDWGDGSDAETVTSDWPSHTYSEVGTYTVSISGTVEHLQSGYEDNNGILYSYIGTSYLTAVKQWGNTGLKSMESAFVLCTNLTSLPDGPGPFENVTNFYYTFYGCNSLEKLPDGLFDNCTKVTSFEQTFRYCESLKELPTGLFDNCTEAINFNYTFQDCTSLEKLPEGLFDNCTKVTSFANTFAWCSALKELPNGLFDKCTEVTDFTYVFYNCTSLVAAPSFEGLSKVTSFDRAFWGCTSLTTIPVNIFSGCTATHFLRTFCDCSSVEGESPYDEINVNGETVKVHLYERENYPEYFAAPTSYGSCFSGCTKLDDYDDIPSSWGGNAN